jgi:hypothetical protein
MISLREKRHNHERESCLDRYKGCLKRKGWARHLEYSPGMELVKENNETRAADEAMRMSAHWVANELRKDRPPNIE